MSSSKIEAIQGIAAGRKGLPFVEGEPSLMFIKPNEDLFMALDANVIAAGFPVLNLNLSDKTRWGAVDFDPQHAGIVLLADSPCCFSAVLPVYFATSFGGMHIKLATLSDRSALVFANLPDHILKSVGTTKLLGCVHVTKPGEQAIVGRFHFWWMNREESIFQVGDVFECDQVFANTERTVIKVIENGPSYYLLVEETKSRNPYKLSIPHAQFKNFLLVRNGRLLAGPTFDKQVMSIRASSQFKNFLISLSDFVSSTNK